MRRFIASYATALLAGPCVSAADALDAETAATVRQLEQAISALRSDTAQRIASLEARIESLTAEAGQASVDSPSAPSDERQSTQADDPLSWFGDFRVRYEHTSAHAGLPKRNRGALRARLGAAYRVGDSVRIAARLGTGNPDDPNSTDISMGNFVDDLTVSLDQAYVAYTDERLAAFAGKFPNPFVHTEMVWDPDVNPYGAAAHYRLFRSDAVSASLQAMYGVVDEQIAAGDSDLFGGQLSLRFTPAGAWAVDADVAYYDHRIGSLINTTAGDIRDNNLTPDGTAYLSDFDLLNASTSLQYTGFGDAWPLRLTADYVKNLGAAVAEDSGYSLDVLVGNLGRIGHTRFRYGYARVETDAVLAAFSHDNTTYATNYRLHTVDVAYRASYQAYVNLTAFLYRRDDFDLVDQPGSNDWVSRFRLNLFYLFE